MANSSATIRIVVVKDFLGHASVATTENYYINTKPALRAAAAARKVRLEEYPGDNGNHSDNSNGKTDAEEGPIGKM